MSADKQNKAFVCNTSGALLKGRDIQESDFEIKDIPYPTLENDGEFIIYSAALSVDPYLLPSVIKSADFKPGTTLSNFSTGVVVESRSEKFPVGAVIQAYSPLQLYTKATNNGEDIAARKVIDPSRDPAEYVSFIGMPSRTAYFFVKYAMELQKGDRVLISGAAGAVGSTAAQIAKILGASKIIGTAGGPEKCKIAVEKYGYDACIDYKANDTIEKMKAALEEHFPEGIDGYFDNTGGNVTYAALDLIRYKARIVICGQISQYNQGPQMCKDFLFKLVYKQARIQGAIYSEYADKIDEADQFLLENLQNGKIVADYTLYNGFEQLPKAFVGLFTGANVGKMVVKP